MSNCASGQTGEDQSSAALVLAFMEENWREPGFTCPNAETYPWLWLWDSCFHSIIWAALGRDDRALLELESALLRQHIDGFVPHIVYFNGFEGHDEFWRASGTSSITQPPIYGHTIAALRRLGIDVPNELIDRARRGLRFLIDSRRRTPGGLIEIVHPWESGCDHSPRWDSLICGDGSVPDDRTWFERKGELVAAVDLVDGSPISSDACSLGSISFNALIAFGADELGHSVGDADLVRDAKQLAGAIEKRWDAELSTWVDEGLTATTSGRVRTLEALLPLLVEVPADQRCAATVELADPDGFAGRFGLRQVHAQEPTYAPDEYWRGASWPQLNYLIQVALRRRGEHATAASVDESSRSGAMASGFSEYWNPDTGAGGGARPQSWTGLVAAPAEAMFDS